MASAPGNGESSSLSQKADNANAANVVAALRILEEKHGISSLRCAGHTLQLVVNHALRDPQISKTLRAAKCLVEHF